MKILYEPAKAREMKGDYYGADGVSIRYPGVNSCLTLTYFFPAKPLLVGLHMGIAVDEKDTFIDSDWVRKTLAQMESLAPEKPADAALIGNIAVFRNFGPALNELRRLVTQRVGRPPRETETGEYHDVTDKLIGTVDIEVSAPGGLDTGMADIFDAANGKLIEFDIFAPA